MHPSRPICRTATSICTYQRVLSPPDFTTRVSRGQSPTVGAAMAKTPLTLVVELVWAHDGAPSRLLSLFDWEHASKDVTCQQSTHRTSAPYRCVHRDPTDACTLNCPRRSDGAFTRRCIAVIKARYTRALGLLRPHGHLTRDAPNALDPLTYGSC